jgi:EmrB/QacA subfamily drug resistance transporter
VSGLRGNPWAVLVALCLGFFMILLDTTIVNIAIPSIIDGLQATLDQVLWVINAYLLVYAVLLITAGRLGDLFGPRNLFMSGLVLFTGASAWCGQAQSPDQLIIARVLQGVGGALLTPQTLAILTTIFPADRRGAAFGIWGGVAGVATVTGPTLGGYLVTNWGWRWIFYVNLPVGIVTFLLTLLVVPDIRPGRRQRLDLTGVVLASAGLFGIVFGLIEGQRFDWGVVTSWSGMGLPSFVITIPEITGAGVILLAVLVLHQALRQRQEPLLPFAIFQDRNYSLMNGVGAAVGFGMLGLFFPYTIYLQSVLGLSAQDAGITVAPISLVSMIVAPVAGRLADRVGGKYILMFGLTLFGIGMSMMTWGAKVDSARWSFLPGMLIAGLGMGCTFAPMVTVAMRNIEPKLAGAASGLINTTRQLGGAMGSAAVGAVLQNQLAMGLHQQAVAHAGQLPPQFRDQFIQAFSTIARGGLEVGRGQTGGSLNLPPGVPAAVITQLRELALEVFKKAYVDAMHPAMVLPVGVMLLAAASCLFIRRRERGPAQELQESIDAAA